MSMPDPYNERPRTNFDEIRDREPGNAWTWIAGAAVIVAIVLALTFGTSQNGDQQANNPSSPTTTTTGSAPSPAPAENTGQQQRAPAGANQ